jgi:hypothetical protein
VSCALAFIAPPLLSRLRREYIPATVNGFAMTLRYVRAVALSDRQALRFSQALDQSELWHSLDEIVEARLRKQNLET